MTKEEVVSFAATPKGFVREEEKETPKDEVKPEPSARKLGSSNRSFATVLGALSAMILGGALASYSIWFEYESGILVASVIVFVGVFVLADPRKKTKMIDSPPAPAPELWGMSDQAVVEPPDPGDNSHGVVASSDPGEIFPRVALPVDPHNEYESWSFDRMHAELKRAEADTDSWVKYAKEGKQKQASLRLEMGKRARDLKITVPPVETTVKRPKKPKVSQNKKPALKENQGTEQAQGGKPSKEEPKLIENQGKEQEPMKTENHPKKPKVTKPATPVPVSERFDEDPEHAADLAAQK